MKWFHCDRQLQFYTYAFLYINPKTVLEEDHFLGTKIFVEKYKKMSTPVKLQNIGLDLVTYVQKIMS